MYSKSGVRIEGLKPETLFGLAICDSVYKERGQSMVVTAVVDGLHKPNSLHYEGFAFDLRTRNLFGITPREMADCLQQALGSQFDVVLEPDHIHVEFDI